MMVAIWTRSAFSEFVTIVNSTGRPAASTSPPSGLPFEAGALQQLLRVRHGTPRLRQRQVHPQLVARRHVAPERRRPPAIDEANDPLAVDRERHRAPKRQLSKPGLPARRLGQRLPGQIVEVEDEEREIDAGAEIRQLVVPLRLIAQQHLEIRGVQPGRDVRFPRLKPHRLRVGVRHDREHEPVEVRQTGPRAIDFPVERVPFEDDLLAGHVLLESIRPEARDVGGAGRQAPRLGQPAFQIWLLEQVPRQHRHVVEEPLGRRVWLAQIELHRLLIQLAHRNRFAADRAADPGTATRPFRRGTRETRTPHRLRRTGDRPRTGSRAAESRCTAGRPARPSRTSPAPAPFAAFRG